MSDPSELRPLINHIAISVDAAVLDESGRADLVRFFGQVFGWVEGDNSTEAGNPLILYTGRAQQYLYLLPAADDFLRAPFLDHFGLEVSSREELSTFVERAEAYRRQDDRVSVSGIGEMITHGTASDFTLTNAYIQFLLPLQIELQYIAERATT